MQAHNLAKSGNKKKKRIGRGGKRGSFSGRGIKGQKSRAGRRIRPQIRDIIKKIHKRRGYGKNRAKSVYAGKIRPEAVNIGDIARLFKDKDKITAKALIGAGLAETKKIKILGGGKTDKKFVFDKNILMSRSVREKFNVG